MTKDKEQVRILATLPLIDGLTRTIYKCSDCKKIQAHDFIPYGFGAGCWYGRCLCASVHVNGILHLKKLKEIKAWVRK